MDRVANLSNRDRSELFSETAARMGIHPAVVEKDFWITWVLSKLFAHPELSKRLMFKGGTSLSKIYRLIERFSEDIDLILDWRGLTDKNPEEERSKSKQDKLNREINERAKDYIAGNLLPIIAEITAPVCTCAVGEDPFVLNVHYPGAFVETYLRPEVRLEIGPLASWLPFDEYRIRPYAAERFPDLFAKPECTVRAIKAERTFWEKATILHHEAHRPDDIIQPQRNSRHYYDMYKMASAPIKESALANLALLESVVAFKQRFYPRGWARYDLARPGTLRLVPKGRVQEAVKADYREMRIMIYGEYPYVESILTKLQELEDEINRLSQF